MNSNERKEIKETKTPTLKVKSQVDSHKADAVTDRTTVDTIIQRFIDNGQIMQACMFVVGINTGSRISDLRGYRVCDVIKDEKKEIIDCITMEEEKTGKARKIHFNKAVKLAFRILVDKKQWFDEWLFTANAGNKSYTTTIDGRELQLPIGNPSWGKNLAAVSSDIDLHISAHTTRKTFGFFFATSCSKYTSDPRSLQLLSETLNHSSTAITSIYLGINDSEIKRTYQSLNLGYDVLKAYAQSIGYTFDSEEDIKEDREITLTQLETFIREHNITASELQTIIDKFKM